MFSNHEALLGGQNSLLALLGLLYDTLDDPGLWPEALAALAAAVGAQHGGMISRDSHAPSGFVNVSHNLDPAMMERYNAYYGALDPYFAATQSVPAGTPIVGSEIVANRDLKASEFYSDFLRPLHIEHQCGVTLEKDARRFSALTLTAEKTRAPFGPEDVAKLDFLTPHLRRILRLHAQLSGTRQHNAGMLSALQAFEKAVFGIAADGTILFATPRAEDLLASARVLYRKGDRLRLRSARQDTELTALLERACTRDLGSVAMGPGPFGSGALTAGAKDGPGLDLVVMSYQGQTDWTLPAQLGALVFVTTPTEQNASRASTLRLLYRLTPTEIRIAEALAEGLDTQLIALQLGGSTNMVRFHLKNLFRKMSVKRQSEVVRIVIALPTDGALI